MQKKGIFLISLSLLFTFILFVFAKDDPSVLIRKPVLAVAQISALFGMILFSYAFLLSSRFSFLENIFGGLDKIYKLHQISGRLSFILIITHFIFLVFNYIQNTSILSMLLFPGKTLSYNLGILSLWSMCFVLSAILYLAIDYQWFVRIQSFFIIPFSLGVVHMLLISSDSSRYLPLTIFLILHTAIAYVSWIYKALLYPIIGPRFEYQVETLKVYSEDVVVLTIAPCNKKMPFLPGQFAYVRFNSIGVRKEFHPFSIASSPSENSIRLAIKTSGDFTTQLKTLKIGEKAILMGPYGRFCERFFGRKDAVCVAGGIGITPFLGMLHYLKDAKLPLVKNLHLFYSVKNWQTALFQRELENISYIEKNLSLNVIHTEKGGRLNVEMIRNTLGELKDKLYFLCGPKLMMEDLAGQLKRMSIPAKNIIYEDFSYK
ncbi:ferredoxin reductase family protein [Candidatus Daviesbacteria bacterium]|nr:ferredoxin reductase family protein [Candidatus Daviesbacteria bacterium]